MSFASVVGRLQRLENPYPGLRPFDVSESHLFFGRDAQIAELVHRLERHRFVAVLGLSGSGKSSLVRAGLVPALERGGVWEAGKRWRLVVTQPAGAPFDRLAADLRAAQLDPSPLKTSSRGLIEVAGQLEPDETLLLVVDQFEEIFRYKDLQQVSDETRQLRDRQAADACEYVQLLLEASRHHPPIFIVITMRSDYLGDCAEFRDLPETLNECQYLVPRMTRQQRQEAIEGPLGRVRIAPSLVQRVLNDAGEEPDHLPVLQHALMRTWARWHAADPQQARRIELEDFEAIGGFAGALDRHAEELLTGLDESVVARVFKRLTARGRGNRERRDPARLGEIWAVCGAETPAQRQQVNAVIDQFRGGDATFLRPRTGPIEAETFIDITHECLIRLWGKMRDRWLPEEQAAAKLLVDLAERANTWKAGSGELVGGLDLIRVEAWDRTRNPTDAWAQHYLDAGTVASVNDYVHASRAMRRRRELRMRAAIVAGLVAVLALGVWEASQLRDDATRERRAKEEAQDRQLQEEAEKAATQQDLQDLQTALVTSRAAAAATREDLKAGASGAEKPSAPNSEARPRVFVQIRPQADRTFVRSLRQALVAGGFAVPEAEALPTGPSVSEVRYFRTAEQAGADRVAGVVRNAGVSDVRTVYVSGYESSDRVRENQFELWLAPIDLLNRLVQQLNDPSADVRKAAGGWLARDHRKNPQAIDKVLDTLSAENLPSLSAAGRINALYFLNRSDPGAWTRAQWQKMQAAAPRMRAARPFGPQMAAELDDLESKARAAGS